MNGKWGLYGCLLARAGLPPVIAVRRRLPEPLSPFTDLASTGQVAQVLFLDSGAHRPANGGELARERVRCRGSPVCYWGLCCVGRLFVPGRLRRRHSLAEK